MELLRLDQWLSRCGFCGRREARLWVRAGRVAVRGNPVRSPETRAAAADIRVDGEGLESPDGLLVAFHKPAGLVCSHDEAEGPTIYGRLPERWLRRNPPVSSVGRLDKESSGLLLLTDRGDWLHRWTSPRHGHTRRYAVEVGGVIPDEMVAAVGAGGLLLKGDDEPLRPIRMTITGPGNCVVELTEGRHRQVRRLFAAFDVLVMRLHRLDFGNYSLGDLAPGQWRFEEPPAF